MNKTVQVLNLESNYVNDKGTIALAYALKVNFCLVPRMFSVFLVTAPLGNPPFFVAYVCLFRVATTAHFVAFWV